MQTLMGRADTLIRGELTTRTLMLAYTSEHNRPMSISSVSFGVVRLAVVPQRLRVAQLLSVGLRVKYDQFVPSPMRREVQTSVQFNPITDSVDIPMYVVMRINPIHDK